MIYFRELRDRHLASTKEAIPVALEYLYGGSNIVQRDDPMEDEIIEAQTSPYLESEIKDSETTEKYDYEELFDKSNVDVRRKEYPYSVYKNIQEPLLKLPQPEKTGLFLIKVPSIVFRGHWAVYFTSPVSFIFIFFVALSNWGLLLNFDWLVH